MLGTRQKRVTWVLPLEKYKGSDFLNCFEKVMLKILQARLQQYMNQELPDVQAGFRKRRGPKMKLPTSVGS